MRHTSVEAHGHGQTYSMVNIKRNKRILWIIRPSQILITTVLRYKYIFLYILPSIHANNYTVHLGFSSPKKVLEKYFMIVMQYHMFAFSIQTILEKWHWVATLMEKIWCHIGAYSHFFRGLKMSAWWIVQYINMNKIN